MQVRLLPEAEKEVLACNDNLSMVLKLYECTDS
jgi:hypothetical protein